MKRIFRMLGFLFLIFGYHTPASATPLSQGDRAKCLQMIAGDYGMATSQTDLNGDLADTNNLLPGCLKTVAATAPWADDIEQMCNDISSKRMDLERAMGRLLQTPSAPVCAAKQQEQAKIASDREQKVATWKANAINEYHMHQFDCPHRPDETPRSARLCAASRIRLALVKFLISQNDSVEQDWSVRTFTGGSTSTDTVAALPYESCPMFNGHAYGVVVATVTTQNGVISDDPNDTQFLSSSGYQDLDHAALERARECRFKGQFSNSSFTIDLPYPLDK